jgi:hypothetical protein
VTQGLTLLPLKRQRFGGWNGYKHETLSKKIASKKGVAQVLERLPPECEALSLNPSTVKKKKSSIHCFAFFAILFNVCCNRTSDPQREVHFCFLSVAMLFLTQENLTPHIRSWERQISFDATPEP